MDLVAVIDPQRACQLATPTAQVDHQATLDPRLFDQLCGRVVGCVECCEVDSEQAEAGSQRNRDTD